MKTLKTVHFIGSRQCKSTGWQRFAGFARTDFTDGTSRTFSEDKNLAAILAELKAIGVSTAEFEAQMEARRQADYAASNPGAKELAAELYQHNNYGYEKPVELGRWQWSTTFGRWARLVTFADGWHGLTYPKLS